MSELPPVQQQAPGGGHHDPLQLRRGPPAQPAAHSRLGTLRTRGERDEVGGYLYNFYTISIQYLNNGTKNRYLKQVCTSAPH